MLPPVRAGHGHGDHAPQPAAGTAGQSTLPGANSASFRAPPARTRRPKRRSLRTFLDVLHERLTCRARQVARRLIAPPPVRPHVPAHGMVRRGAAEGPAAPNSTIEAARRLVLATRKRKNLPALALTGYARSKDRMKAVFAGFQPHSTKPVEVTELLILVAGRAGCSPSTCRATRRRAKHPCHCLEGER